MEPDLIQGGSSPYPVTALQALFSEYEDKEMCDLAQLIMLAGCGAIGTPCPKPLSWGFVSRSVSWSTIHPSFHHSFVGSFICLFSKSVAHQVSSRAESTCDTSFRLPGQCLPPPPPLGVTSPSLPSHQLKPFQHFFEQSSFPSP